jgi:hypothetical protein
MLKETIAATIRACRPAMHGVEAARRSSVATPRNDLMHTLPCYPEFVGNRLVGNLIPDG